VRRRVDDAIDHERRHPEWRRRLSGGLAGDRRPTTIPALNDDESLRDVGQAVIKTPFHHDPACQATRFLGVDEWEEMRVIPEEARGLVKRNLVLVRALRQGPDVDEYVVAVAARADVHPVKVQVRRQRKPVGEMDHQTIPGQMTSIGPGS